MQHGVAAVSTVSSQQERSWFDHVLKWVSSGFSSFLPQSESDKVLKSYRIKGFINVWLNVACILKHNETI